MCRAQVELSKTRDALTPLPSCGKKQQNVLIYWSLIDQG